MQLWRKQPEPGGFGADDDRELTDLGQAQSNRRGLRRTYQISLLFAGLSVVDDRYGARMAWLLPFWSLAAVAALLGLKPGCPARR